MNGNHALKGKLSQLLHDTPLEVDFNNYQLQSADYRNISSCGQWCVARLRMQDLSTDEFAELWGIRDDQYSAR